MRKALPFFALLLAAPAWAAGAWETDPQAYTIKLENQKVRVLDVYYPAGYKVKAHELRDRLVWVKADAKLVQRDSRGIEKVFKARAHEYSWEKAETMEIENVGSSEYRAVWVEMKG